jgi:hypothetical protein
MADIITDELIREIISQQDAACISIYLPTYETGAEVRQNAIRFRNLVEQARRELADRRSEIAPGLRKKLDQLAELADNHLLWQHQARGLAVFLSDDYERQLKLPVTVEERVQIDNRFLVTPLAKQRLHAQEYGVLAITWQQTQLYVGRGEQLEPHSDDRFPLTLEQVVGVADPEEHLQYESYRIRGARGDKAVYHGHGQGEDEIEADRYNYLSRVGDIISELNYGTGQPVVLVATQEVGGWFQSASELPIFERVETSPESLLGDELSRRVWDAISEHGRRDVADVQERLGTAVAQGQGSQELTDVVVAAAQGRVDTLIVRSAEPIYGIWNDADQEVRRAEPNEPSACDLVNLAVSKTWQSSGKVLFSDSGEDPKQAGAVAAIYRY